MTPENFISKLSLHFRFHVDSPEAQAEWSMDALKAIRGTAPHALDAAAEAIVAGRTSPFFPTIGEIRHAIQSAAYKLAPHKSINEQQAAWPEPTPEQKAMVNALVAEFKRNVAAKTLHEEAKKLPDVSRHSFEKMMRQSQNQELHAGTQLTERSRRMMGDDA